MYVERRVKKVDGGLDFPSADIALQYKARQILLNVCCCKVLCSMY